MLCHVCLLFCIALILCHMLLRIEPKEEFESGLIEPKVLHFSWWHSGQNFDVIKSKRLSDWCTSWDEFTWLVKKRRLVDRKICSWTCVSLRRVQSTAYSLVICFYTIYSNFASKSGRLKSVSSFTSLSIIVGPPRCLTILFCPKLSDQSMFFLYVATLI